MIRNTRSRTRGTPNPAPVAEVPAAPETEVRAPRMHDLEPAAAAPMTPSRKAATSSRRVAKVVAQFGGPAPKRRLSVAKASPKHPAKDAQKKSTTDPAPQIQTRTIKEVVADIDNNKVMVPFPPLDVNPAVAHAKSPSPKKKDVSPLTETTTQEPATASLGTPIAALPKVFSFNFAKAAIPAAATNPNACSSPLKKCILRSLEDDEEDPDVSFTIPSPVPISKRAKSSSKSSRHATQSSTTTPAAVSEVEVLPESSTVSDEPATATATVAEPTQQPTQQPTNEQPPPPATPTKYNIDLVRALSGTPKFDFSDTYGSPAPIQDQLVGKKRGRGGAVTTFAPETPGTVVKGGVKKRMRVSRGEDEDVGVLTGGGDLVAPAAEDHTAGVMGVSVVEDGRVSPPRKMSKPRSPFAQKRALAAAAAAASSSVDAVVGEGAVEQKNYIEVGTRGGESEEEDDELEIQHGGVQQQQNTMASWFWKPFQKVGEALALAEF
ncbi:hypothetical protein HDU98_006189 [Podochytrium sp. JEL0797]|nr:hypothetical protein HDU98_006189 [Podochytrium sp. JEL0797]